MTFLEDQGARVLPRVFSFQTFRMNVLHVMHRALRPSAARRAFAAIACDSVKVPKAWYNIQADLKVPLPPPLHPGELRPCLPDDFAPLFPMSLIQQEMSTEREIDIPEPVREVLELWRPSPLFRASRWEKALKLPQDVKIFYKYEGGSPSGSHKTNTAVAQIFYNKEAGTKKVTTETGAGQWEVPWHFPEHNSICQLKSTR